MLSDEASSQPDLKEAYARTRRTLIERLQDWEDQRTWDDFYKTYWRLIYSVSMRAGLPSDEAFDVVQETVLSIAKQWEKGRRSLRSGERFIQELAVECRQVADRGSVSQTSA